MRAVMKSSWTQAARCAALAALLCVPQLSWGQNDLSSGPPSGLGGYSDDFGSLFAPKSADSVFEQYASLNRLAVAWKEMNSSSMTDVALQFAEGERVLLRSHKLLTASQAFDLAIRMATENKDKDSLARLAKALERSGDKDRLGQVNLALKTAGAARGVDPVLNEGSKDTVEAIQVAQAEIAFARIAGNKGHLSIVEKSLGELPISDKQRASLGKIIAESRESLVENKDVTQTTRVLDHISNVGRPIDIVSPPAGNKFAPIDLSYPKATEAEKRDYLEWLSSTGETPSSKILIGDDSDESTLEKLQGQSRIGFGLKSATTSYGHRAIWQYTNDGGMYPGYCCGQAAMATMLTRWFPEQFSYIRGPEHVRRLEGTNPPSWTGTSWQTMQAMAVRHKMKYEWIYGEAKLRDTIRAGYPVIVMLDVGKGRAEGNFNLLFGTIGGHWVVAYAFDGTPTAATQYYLTNWGPTENASYSISRASFMKGWGDNARKYGDTKTWPESSPLTNAAGTTMWGLKISR